MYLLDTDTCAYVMKRSNAALLDRLREVPIDEQAVSVISVAELQFGVRLSSRPDQAAAAFAAFVRHLVVLDWGGDAADHYADIRADLRRRGAMIGANDLLIAAHARALEATLVTNNVREFRRVRNLKLENWVR
ncbi:MAG: type II toxin-antitoxin system VapC family toxin [Burkholderiaceae bacterium]|nr:type II toxin-antitoxin system VapC family toxin [Burkholderiaceae bacterium]MEB2352663.1 type II toxin-antitoxin system VapC family toxin [Burkholderiaceae bacterium]